MKVLVLAAIASALIAGPVLAQEAAPPPPPGLAAEAPPPPGHGPGPHGGPMMPPPPPSKAAHFIVERAGTRVDVKCADDEPMKPCADVLMSVLDRVGSGPAPGAAPTP